MNPTNVLFNRSPSAVRLGAHAGARQISSPPAGLQESSRAAADRQQYVELLNALSMSVSELQSQQRQSLRELQHVAVELATVAASWLTHEAIDRNQFNVQKLVQLAVEELDGNRPVMIHLNPLDHELFQRVLESEECDETTRTAFSEIQTVSDARQLRGSCKAVTENISLVTDLETRLACVRQAWMENLDDAQTERRATDSSSWEPGRVPDRRETA